MEEKSIVNDHVVGIIRVLMINLFYFMDIVNNYSNIDYKKSKQKEDCIINDTK